MEIIVFMCGIVGYYGENAFEMVKDVLYRLEYRGYDSVGIAVHDGNKIHVHKSPGNVSSLFSNLRPIKGEIAVGHTRWATHGEVNELNAHPVSSNGGKYIIVHNGVVENFSELKESLKNKGYTFKTETDTEVIANLLEEYDDPNKLLDLIKGDFAVVGITGSKLFGIKRGEPLVIGYTNSGYVVSSDINSIAHLAKDAIILDDDDSFVIENGELKLNSKHEKKKVKVDGSYSIEIRDEYTLKEIIEGMRNKSYDYKINFSDFDKVILVGAGSSYNAALFGSLLFLSKGITSFAVLSPEFSNYKALVDKNSLVIAISQSGETADTIRALKMAKESGAKVYSILNVPHSTMERLSDLTFHMEIGPEVGVVATKSFMATIRILCSLVDEKCGGANVDFNLVKSIAEKFKGIEHIYIVGSGLGYPLAREGALKIKEISYIHAEAFESGEFKHGNIALIERGTPVIGISIDGVTKNNLVEVKSRGAFVVGLSKNPSDEFDVQIKISNFEDIILFFQVLGYYLAKLRGLNPDRPRNLAKSVTVI